MRGVAIGLVALALSGCGDDSKAAPDAFAAGDAAPGLPSCSSGITVNSPGPAITVDTCTGTQVSVPTCNGTYAKAVVVRLSLFPPGNIYYVDQSIARWLSPISSDCSSAASGCGAIGGTVHDGYYLVENPDGGCGVITLQVNYRSG